jgi:hypothetical protein
MCGPAAIHRQGDTGDRCGRRAGKEDGKGAQLLDGGEALIWLLREEHLADDLFERQVTPKSR